MAACMPIKCKQGITTMDVLCDLTENILLLENDVFQMDGIQGDLVIKTGDRSFKVHKNVLKSVPYFAAIIDGQWQESHISEITLQGYSSKSVLFVLEHLYVPKATVVLDDNLVELMAITDMLGLVTLMNALCTAMNINLCHNFHKPCQHCIAGVVTTLQLTNCYNQIELRRKCMEWLSKYFSKTWNSRSFAALHPTLQTESYKTLKDSIAVGKVIELALECQRLQDTLPKVKWVLPVDSLVQQLSAACIAYLQQHFDQVLQSPQFESLKKMRNAWDLSRIEAILLEAAVELPVDQCCLSYLCLESFLTVNNELQTEDDQPDAIYLDFVYKLHKTVQSRLILRVAMATKCKGWNSLPKEMQTNIMQLGFFNPLETRKVVNDGSKVNRSQSLLDHEGRNSTVRGGKTTSTRTVSPAQPRCALSNPRHTAARNSSSQVRNVATHSNTSIRSQTNSRVRGQNATRTAVGVRSANSAGNPSTISTSRLQRISQSTSENTS